MRAARARTSAAARASAAAPATPGDKQCNGLTPQSCDSTGKWVNGTACQYVCSTTTGMCTGSCVPQTNACFDSQTPETCDSTGTWQKKPPCTNSVCLNG